MPNVAAMSTTDRLAEVLRRSKKHLGPDAAQAIDSLLSPLNLSIMAGTLVVWAGSHFFGVGEIVDVLHYCNTWRKRWPRPTRNSGSMASPALWRA